jgi:hypothetical protein
MLVEANIKESAEQKIWLKLIKVLKPLRGALLNMIGVR